MRFGRPILAAACIALLLLLILGLRGHIGKTVTSDGVVRTKEFVWVGGRLRQFVVFRPEKLKEGIRYPVIVGFHGNRSEAKAWFHEFTRFDEMVSEREFILALPEGPISWATGAGSPDLAFFDSVVDKLRSKYSVDDNRIYIAGHSNGAVFAGSLVLARPEAIAAAALCSGLFPVTPTDIPTAGRLPAMIIFLGSDDPIGRPDARYIQSTIGVLQSNGSEVEMRILQGGGHAWGEEKYRVEESILEFFAAHQSRRAEPGTLRE